MNAAKKRRLEKALQLFSDDNEVAGKGPLSVVLVLNRRAKSMSLPLDPIDFLTPKGGQVAGLSGSGVQSVLADHGITRVLSEEGGRTSRGSIDRMRGYLDLLNRLHSNGLLDFDAVESWWVARVREYFASEPLRLKADASKSLRAILAELIEAAFERQKECPGTMVAGAVMQHLVGAKLQVALPSIEIKHEGFSVADAPSQRKGDFIIHDTAVHVTTAPTEALIRKCSRNLADNVRPLIITTETGVGGAKALAKNAEVADRIDILDIEQFIATNVYEWSAFQHEKRPTSIDEMVAAYNDIIDQCETDPSLRIYLG